jgi:hypothetical protein
MNHSIHLPVACGLLAAAVMSFPVMAQNAAPKDPSGMTAPPGTAVAPPKNATNDGGKRAPTDTSGKTAPAGTPIAPSRLAVPDATPSPQSTKPP